MILALGCSWAAMAQPAYDLKAMNREQLNRGVVAVRNGQQVVVSGRTLTTDPVGEAYDVYRNGQKLNRKPLTKGGTFFVDEQPLDGEAIYEVKGGQKNGRFVLAKESPDGYLPVKLLNLRFQFLNSLHQLILIHRQSFLPSKSKCCCHSFCV